MKTALSFIAGASLLALVSSAGAQEPIKLSDLQMDRVTAGASVTLLGTADATSAGAALANVLGAATVKTQTLADPIGTTNGGIPIAAAAATSTAAATSVFGVGFALPNAAAASASTATAALQ